MNIKRPILSIQYTGDIDLPQNAPARNFIEIDSTLKNHADVLEYIIDKIDSTSETNGSPLYELIGQSNADGQARKSELPSGYQGPLQDCYIFTPATTGFELLEGGVTSSTSGGDNWGLEISMMKQLASSTGKRVNVAKYAVPGTQLAQTSSDKDWSQNSSGEYYDLANANTANARASLADHPIPTAIIWDQGESDANASYADLYEQNLRNFIAARRTYLGSAVPFIIVKLSSAQTFLDPTYLEKIRTAQVNVASSVQGCYLVETDDLPLDGAKLHYTAAGLITLGQRIATLVGNLPSAPAAALAPLVTGDDLANSITVTHRYGVSGTEVLVGSSSSYVTFTSAAGYDAQSGKILVGDVNLPAGYYSFRSAADPSTGRLASSSVPSPAFTMAATGPANPNLFNVTDLSSSAWNPADVDVISNQADYNGGTSAYLVRPNASNNNSHTLHYDPISITSDQYEFTVEALPGGYSHASLIMLSNGSFQIVSIATFDLQAGTKVSSSGGDGTVAGLAQGWNRIRLSFSLPAGSYFPFLKVQSDASDSSFSGDGSGLYVRSPAFRKV